MKKINILLITLLIALSAFFYAGEASALNIPAGWSCTGNCGTLGANGVVTLSPYGDPQYGYVASNTGITGLGILGGEDGSILRSSAFAANAGDDLVFYFNYVTSDGSGFADYAWSRLLDSTLNPVAVLFTARTTPNGNSVPGFGMPPITATIDPATVTIIPGGPSWSPLGGYSGRCYSGVGNGCGYSGWVKSTYDIASAGSYILEFGVVDWSDEIYDSGMAFDGITVAGKPIDDDIPEPSTLLLVGSGLVGLAGLRRKMK